MVSLDCHLDDMYKLSAHGIEPVICSGREICRAAGYSEREIMLYAQLTRFGFTGVKVEKILKTEGIKNDSH